MNHIIAGVREAGQIVRNALDLVEKHIAVGMKTQEIDDICAEYFRSVGAESGCLGYRGGGSSPYPRHTCVSVNDVICHGIPGSRVIKDGDLVNVDLVVKYKGYYADAARTFCVGEVRDEMRDLSEHTRNARDAGIAVVRPGAFTGDIGHAIESYVKQFGGRYKIVTSYCGHGIGKEMHQDPSILNYGQPGSGLLLTEGMIFTVEPILVISRNLDNNHLTRAVVELNDSWTVVTKDGSWSAQWEHTLCVTKDGYEILA